MPKIDYRQLPTMHVSLRVPWHDRGWDGRVCNAPAANGACLALRRTAEGRDDAAEGSCAGRPFSDLLSEGKVELPPCVGERGFFLSPDEFVTTIRHPYVAKAKKDSIYLPLAPTPLPRPAYAAQGVPFRWMLRASVEGEQGVLGLREEYALRGYEPKREPSERFEGYEWTRTWVQDHRNQRALLDTFFSAFKPQESLCFFYAKRSPLADDPRRVLVGVGRITRVGEPTEYNYEGKPQLRSSLWERDLFHSIRPECSDGFVLPYQQLLARADRDATMRLDDYVAFLPEEHREEFSYATEHVGHDAAISALQSLAGALRKIKDILEGPWERCLRWIDVELARLWRLRGPFPGLGAALQAFGLEHGNLLAMQITQAIAKEDAVLRENPWDIFAALLEDPTMLGEEAAQWLGPTYRAMWESLHESDRSTLQLLSRFALTKEQAEALFCLEKPAREEFIANPYLAFERQQFGITVGTIDRGMLPDTAVREAFPLPAPTALSDPADPRRTRAFARDALLRFAQEGHTVVPRRWVAEALAGREVEPRLVASGPSLDLAKSTFGEQILVSTLGDGSEGWQLETFVTTAEVLRKTVEGRLGPKAKRFARRHQWRRLLDAALGPIAEDPVGAEERARAEKAAVLEEVFASRMSVLLGPAGTGKTTLLKVLIGQEEVRDGGVLMLAPTGKARVNLEAHTKGDAMTVAQFLLRTKRFDPKTGEYSVTRNAETRQSGWKTVIIDECSMLTELQLAALFDSLSGVDRYVLVGDPRQLPPIGEGRPFVDIVQKLAPEGVAALSPRVGRGYAELTVVRRQEGAGASGERDDVVLARWFGGGTLDAAIDEAWARVASGSSKEVQAIRWINEADLEEKLLELLVRELSLSGVEDEGGFGSSFSGVAPFNGQCYPNQRCKEHQAYCCSKHVSGWQILTPRRITQSGSDALNRVVQQRLRARSFSFAMQARTRTPRPIGPQRIIFGDKVLCVTNGTYSTYGEGGRAKHYIANGTLGVVVGEFSKNYRPERLEVSFESLQNQKVQWWLSSLRSDEGEVPLELAYALTVHKAQGSQFDTVIVVVPERSLLLSREMLYTALTRQKKRLILLHQGPLRSLLEYGSPSRSDIARRMTNVFGPPKPVSVSSVFLDEHLVHRTRRGELVRSKSEVAIADLLFSLGKDYLYEKPLEVGGTVKYPDFTIEDSDSGHVFYLEHLGMLDDPGYRARWEQKLAWYASVGITCEGGENGTLLLTDEQGGHLDMPTIEARLRKALDV